VNTIDTSRWSPPSPDPSALAYDSTQDRLLVTDGEVEEMSMYSGVNYYEASRGGNLLRSTNTLSFSPEPVGAAFDAGGRLFVTDDDADRVFQISLGLNGQYDPTDPVSSFSTKTFGATDPEGASYDRATGRLFIADGENSEIYEISPVDGVFGNGNDQIRHFDIASLGINDAETVEFDPTAGTLYTIGDNGDAIVELTPSGAVVSEIDTSQIPFQRPAGLALAPRSTDPSKRSFYVADRGLDNDPHPTENDGAIYEIAPGESGGGPPAGDRRVAQGSDDAEEASSGSVSLSSSDLELVTDGSTKQTVGMRFANLGIPAGATITSAYVQFTADESQSEATSLDLRANASDNAPTYSTASQNVSSRPRTNASVPWAPGPWTAGQAGLDQRTPDLSRVVQEVVDRPGWSSTNALGLTVTGTGHRTAVAFEGSASKAPLLHIEYLPPGEANRPPAVSAGADRTVTLPASAELDGTVSDDGKPTGALTTGWTKVSGPGTVNFADPSAVDTQATFSEAGTYVLRLTGDDGELTTSDDVTVTVGAPGDITLERRVGASADDAEEAASGSVGLTSSDLELVADGSTQTVGVRFANLGIPAGATITKAYIQFSTDETQSGATSLILKGQAADNAAAFTTASTNVSSRPRTGASVSWVPPAWTTIGQAGPGQRTPELAPVVQEIVGRPGWASNNALALIVTGTGHRTAKAFNGSSTEAPLLHVEYRN